MSMVQYNYVFHSIYTTCMYVALNRTPLDQESVLIREVLSI